MRPTFSLLRLVLVALGTVTVFAAALALAAGALALAGAGWSLSWTGQLAVKAAPALVGAARTIIPTLPAPTARVSWVRSVPGGAR